MEKRKVDSAATEVEMIEDEMEEIGSTVVGATAYCVAPTRDERVVAVACYTADRVVLVDVVEHEVLVDQAVQTTVMGMDFSHHEKQMLAIGTGFRDCDVRVYEPYELGDKELKQLASHQGHSNWVESLQWCSSAGREDYFISGSWDNSVRIWHYLGGAVMQLAGPAEIVSGVCWSPCGEYCAAASNEAKVYVYMLPKGLLESEERVESIPPLHVLTDMHSSWCRSVAFAPDGHCLASAGEDGIVALSDHLTGECLAQLQRDGKESSSLHSVCWSECGSFLIAAGRAGVVNVYRAGSDPQIIFTTTISTDVIRDIRLLPKTHAVVAGSHDEIVHVHRLPHVLSGATSMVSFLFAATDETTATQQHFFSSDLFDSNLLYVIYGLLSPTKGYTVS